MRRGTAQFFGRDHLIGHRFDHIGPRDEHIRAVFDHQNEIGHRGGINRAAGARTHDQADLRHHARSQNIALEHFGISCERGNPLLDTRSARIVYANHRRAILQRHIHDFTNFLGMRLRERAPEHGEVLRENINHSAINRAPTGDHTIAGRALFFHTKISAAMRNKHVKLFETVFIQQQLNPFARG